MSEPLGAVICVYLKENMLYVHVIKQKQRQYVEASENVLVEMRRNDSGGERVGASEGTGKKSFSWCWTLNHCQVECVVHAHCDCEALQSI